jgi:acetyl-CoA carboxylase biotin carboxyl carrier protein
VTQIIRAEMVASVHSIVAEVGQVVEIGEAIVILESMKMEIPVCADEQGTVSEIAVAPGDVVREGDVIAIVL